MCNRPLNGVQESRHERRTLSPSTKGYSLTNFFAVTVEFFRGYAMPQQNHELPPVFLGSWDQAEFFRFAVTVESTESALS